MQLVEEPLAAEPIATDGRGLAVAVAQNRSVIRIPAFATSDEVALLRVEGERAAAEQRENKLTSSATRQRVEVFGRTLSSGGTLSSLSPTVQALANILVRRAIQLVQTQLTALADSEGLADCGPDTPLDYSEGEPAINIYWPGGSFKAHRDMRALTLLLQLSNHGDDYEGGGTAFFPADTEPSDALRCKVAPTAVLRPAAGTALLWSGTLVHAGAQVTVGRRLVFVASFTPIFDERSRRVP